MNKAIIYGRVGQDPELKYTESGQGRTTFSVATTAVWKDKNTGEKQEKTTWHNVVVWGKRAEVIKEYVGKGDAILIEGEIENRSYDKDDGTKGYISEIVLRNFEFGAKKGAGGSKGAPPPDAPPEHGDPAMSGDDDLPF